MVAQNAVLTNNFRQNELAKLSENSTEKIAADLEKMTVDDEVNRRLGKLNSN
jgi:phage shock protein A